MPNNKKRLAIFGPILKKNTKNMYCFKISFNSEEEAEKYKEAFIWYVESDRYNVRRMKGYNEKK
jgi:hypothetical protein